MIEAGIRFVREPKQASYGTVAVFEDLWAGNTLVVLADGYVYAERVKINLNSPKPSQVKLTTRPASRRAQPLSSSRDRIAAPNAPPRWLRRSLQSRQARHTGRRPFFNQVRSIPNSPKKALPLSVRTNCSSPAMKPYWHGTWYWAD